MHVHKDLGGLGIDTLEDIIGYKKLQVLMKGLNGKGIFGKLMTQAVDRLQHYTQPNQSPLEAGTRHVVDNNDMWVLTLSKWMEKNKITIKTKKKGNLQNELRRRHGDSRCYEHDNGKTNSMKLGT